MFFWIVNFALFGSYSLVLHRTKKESVFLIVSFIHFAIIAICRDVSVGTDTYNYSSVYNVLKDSGGMTSSHIAASSEVFALYLKAMTHIFPFTSGYMISTSLPSIMCVFYFIKQCSENYFYSVYLYGTFYFYFFSLNASRQFLAIGLILVCYVLVKKNKVFTSIVIFLLACNIHSAACIFIIYYCLKFIHWNDKRLLLCILGITITVPMATKFLNLFLRIYPQYDWMKSILFSSKYLSQGRMSLVYASYCLISIMIGLLFVLQNKINMKVKGRRLLKPIAGNESLQKEYEQIIILYLAFCIEVIYQNSILITRMVYTFLIFLIVFLTNSLEKIVWHKKIVCFGIFGVAFVFMILLLNGNYSNVLNYHFIWESAIKR